MLETLSDDDYVNVVSVSIHTANIKRNKCGLYLYLFYYFKLQSLQFLENPVQKVPVMLYVL